MSLATNIQDLATRLGTEFKTVYGKVGTLTSLTTTAKTDLVSAINEVAAAAAAATGIDDTTSGTTTTYSSSKIISVVDAGDSATLSSANSYTDSQIDTRPVINDATEGTATVYSSVKVNDNIESAATATLSSANTFATTAANNAEAAAKTYTDSEIDLLPVISDTTSTTTSLWSSSKTASEIGTAATGALDSAKTYADGVGTAAVTSANSYTDSAVGALPDIDDVTASTTSLFSSSETVSRIDTAVAGIVDSSPETLNTLNELAAALGDDPNFATTTSTALGNRVRFDAAQTLSGAQQVQARANIGAGTSDLVIGTTAGTAKAGDYAPPAASEAVAGVVELATTTETTTGTDTTRAVTPAGLKAVSDLKAAAAHTHASADISDATATGRSVLTATDAAAARTAIGAGTSSLVLGTIAGTAADAAAVGDTTTNFVATFEAALV